jgi:hypothetical protein
MFFDPTAEVKSEVVQNVNFLWITPHCRTGLGNCCAETVTELAGRTVRSVMMVTFAACRIKCIISKGFNIIVVAVIVLQDFFATNSFLMILGPPSITGQKYQEETTFLCQITSCTIFLVL